MASRSKSSSRWLQEHETDPFVKAARTAGYRSRAVYKLEEIQSTDRTLKPGTMVVDLGVVDLGAAPGGSSQYAARYLQGKSRIITSDILAMDSISGLNSCRAISRPIDGFAKLLELLGKQRHQLVMSDMAPNMPE